MWRCRFVGEHTFDELESISQNNKTDAFGSFWRKYVFAHQAIFLACGQFVAQPHGNYYGFVKSRVAPEDSFIEGRRRFVDVLFEIIRIDGLA